MITKTGANMLSHIKLFAETAPQATKTDGTTVQQSVSNSQYFLRLCSFRNTVDTVGSASQGGMVMNLGVGTTEPTEDDYWLDETEVGGVDINTIVTCQGSSTWNPTQLDNGNVAYTYTFRNIGSSEVTVREIALSFVCTTGKFMFARCLVPPRTIQPGETVTFSYELAFA